MTRVSIHKKLSKHISKLVNLTLLRHTLNNSVSTCSNKLPTFANSHQSLTPNLYKSPTSDLVHDHYASYKIKLLPTLLLNDRGASYKINSQLYCFRTMVLLTKLNNTQVYCYMTMVLLTKSNPNLHPKKSTLNLQKRESVKNK